MIGQTLCYLTLIKPKMQGNYGHRKYDKHGHKDVRKVYRQTKHQWLNMSGLRI
jgi:hypothetical protein